MGPRKAATDIIRVYIAARVDITRARPIPQTVAIATGTPEETRRQYWEYAAAGAAGVAGGALLMHEAHEISMFDAHDNGSTESYN